MSSEKLKDKFGTAQVEYIQDCAILSPPDEFTLYTAPDFKQKISPEFDNEAVNFIVIDFARTSFIDSSSLGLLVGAHKRIKAANRQQLILCNMDKPVRTMFSITGLERILNIVEAAPEPGSSQK